MVDKLLVPIDGSPQSSNALTYAIETFPDATLVVAHVLNPVQGTAGLDGPSSYDVSVVEDQERWANELFDEVKDSVDDDRTVETVLLTGSPSREIVEYADESDVDGIVMGSHGRDGAARLLLGSVAETVVRRSPVPVTVVR